MKLNSYEKWKSSVSSLASSLSEAGNEEEARALLGRILLVNPQEFDVRKKHWEMLLASQQLNRYRNQCRSEGLYLIQSGIRNDKTQESFEFLKALATRFPEDVNFLTKAAKLAGRLGDEEMAESYYKTVANLYLAKRLPMKAIEMFEQIIALIPERFQYNGNIAEIYLQENLPKKAAEYHFTLAHQYLEHHHPEEAAESLNRVLSLDPANLEATFLLAQVYLEQTQTSEASKVIHQQTEVLVQRGLIDEVIGFYDRYIALLQKFGLPDQVNGERESLARRLLTVGRRDQALQLFTQVAEEALSLGHLDKYVELMLQGVTPDAESSDLTKVMEVYQKIILAAANRDQNKARSLLDEFINKLFKREKIRELDRSLRDLSQALVANNEGAFADEALTRLAEVYVSIYKLQEAVQVYESITEKGEKNPEIYVRLAELHLKQENASLGIDCYLKAAELFLKSNHPDRAEEILAFALKHDSNNPSIPARIGSIFYGLGAWDKALEYFQMALAIDSYHRQAVVGTAMTYAKKGKLDEMVGLARRLVTKGLVAEIIEEYRKALAISSAPEEASLSLGALYQELGFLEEAVVEFQKASRDSKHFLRACNQLGLCFKAQGFNDLAIRQYRKALEGASFSEEETLEIRYNLALTYEEIRMYREANELYNDILMLDISYKDVKDRMKNLRNFETTGKVVSFPPEGDRAGKDK